MNDNTVRKIAVEPQITVDTPAQTAPVAAPTPSKVPFSGLERFGLCCVAVVTLVLMVLLVQTNVGVASAQRQLQNVQSHITQVQSSNVDLRQEVSELSSSDRLSAYAQKNGLAFDDANVRNVSK